MGDLDSIDLDAVAAEAAHAFQFTSAQSKVVRHLLEGRCVKDIAAALARHPRTITDFRQRIRRKAESGPGVGLVLRLHEPWVRCRLGVARVNVEACARAYARKYGLTSKQAAAVKTVLEGRTIAQAARDLGKHLGTVKASLQAARSKAAAEGRTELAAKAVMAWIESRRTAGGGRRMGGRI
jgi:DNA-binding NarL/FixJ family response regulator